MIRLEHKEQAILRPRAPNVKRDYANTGGTRAQHRKVGNPAPSTCLPVCPPLPVPLAISSLATAVRNIFFFSPETKPVQGPNQALVWSRREKLSLPPSRHKEKKCSSPHAFPPPRSAPALLANSPPLPIRCPSPPPTAAALPPPLPLLPSTSPSPSPSRIPTRTPRILGPRI